MVELRKCVDDYLKVRDEIEPGLIETLIKDESMEESVEYLPVSDKKKDIIKLTVTILKNKRKYLDEKSKLETAVNDYISKEGSISQIAKNYKISYNVLCNEVRKRRDLGEKYQYDRKIIGRKFNFTYQEEEFLWKVLKETMIELQSCFCKTCVLIELSILVYKFAKQNNKQCLALWEVIRRADLGWLKEFEIRHSNEISDFCSNSCFFA